jgi:hypothetical protein
VVEEMAEGDGGCLRQTGVPAGYRGGEATAAFLTEREDDGSEQALREAIGEEQRR